MAELPRIKVCGLTRLEDARAALAAGADALGFVCYPRSPRHVDAALVGGWTRELPAGIATVAVLVDASPESAREHLAQSGLGWAQLCGREQPEAWRGFEAPLLRRLAVEEGAEAELERWRGVAAGFVLDHPAGPGGSGRRVDRALAARLARRAPCLLAGGLDGTSVAEAVLEVAPHGVDASSRLESSPGIKDPARVAAYVRAARRALAEVTR